MITTKIIPNKMKRLIPKYQKAWGDLVAPVDNTYVARQYIMENNTNYDRDKIIKALNNRKQPEQKPVQEPELHHFIQYFMSKGLAEPQARGIYGNIMQESQGDSEATSKDGHSSYGLAQWTGGRKEKLFKMHGNKPTEQQQLDYLWWELNGPYKKVLERLKKSNTIEEATNIIMKYYEVPHPAYANYENRLKYAKS